jgi:hypothetical protein
MIRISLLSICVAALFVSLACWSGSDVHPSHQEPTTAGDMKSWETAAPDAESVTALKRHIVECTAVTSKYQTLDGSRILRFQNDLVTITISIPESIQYFEKHFSAYPNLEDEKALADKFRSEADTHSKYRYEDFAWRERDRLRYCIAAQLEAGEYVITVNGTGETVPQISVCRYSWVRGPLDSTGGRMFFLKGGRAFFIVCDWIS